MAIGLQGGAESDGAGVKMRSEITYRARLRVGYGCTRRSTAMTFSRDFK
jgi:hypothetical protein